MKEFQGMMQSVQSTLMKVSFVVLLVCSVVMPFGAFAGAQQKETVIRADWGATTQEEWDALEAALKDLGATQAQGNEARFADAPASESWSAKDKSAEEVAAWVRQQAAQLRAGGCYTITVTGRVWIPIWRDWVQVEVSVRICPE
jgi:hypothetical protein